ncbi:MAG: DNA primase [Acidobacteriota bacterium]
MKNQELTSDRERVHDGADIVELASVYTTLKKRGGKYLGLCPFHQEKTPSFTVDAERKLYYCFGCHRGGDLFSLVMEMERLTFPEALRYLAGRYHIQLTGGPRELAARGERKRLIEVNELAQTFFQRCLGAPDGRTAREFLARRRVSADSVALFRLGYAPPQWDRLSTHLRREGVPAEMILKAGLAAQGHTAGSIYDRFRDRLIFPICSDSGEVIGFGGRTLVGAAGSSAPARPQATPESAGPKFLNSPETAVYTKGKQFYGMHLSRDHIRKSGAAVIVEGYMDFILLYQEGLRNCVASLGTALTRPQVKLLARHGVAGILNFDPDAAGREAMIKSLQIFFEEDVPVRVLSLSGEKDPDEFILSDGLAAYEALAKEAPTGEVFALDTLFCAYRGHNDEKRVADIAAFLRLARCISNAVRQEMALREASARFGIGVEQLRAEMSKIPAPAEGGEGRPASAAGMPQRSLAASPSHAERRLLIYGLAGPERYREIASGLGSAVRLACGGIFKKLSMLAARDTAYDERRVYSVLSAEEAAVVTRILLEEEGAGVPTREEALSCLEALQNDVRQTAHLQAGVEAAGDDPALLAEALRRKQESARKRHEISIVK